MKKTVSGVIILVLIIYLGAGWFFSGMIINGGNRGYDEAEEQERLINAGLTEMPARESVRIASGNVTLAGSFYENPSEGNCAVILLPGRGGQRAGTMRVAPVFWERNCDILAYDLRGSGESSVSYHTYGYYDKEDASAAITWLSNRTSLAPNQIGIWGGSYGSAVALQTLGERDDLGFVVADSTFSSLESIVTEHGTRMMGSWVTPFVPGALFFADIRADFEPDEVSIASTVANTNTPILLIHGVEDHVNSVSHSEIIYATSNHDTTVLAITDWGPGHVSSIRHDYDAYAELVYAFFDSHIPALLR
ncbi:MAG: alpha/beta fold hydrolase [Chloroflexota bacterium]